MAVTPISQTIAGISVYPERSDPTNFDSKAEQFSEDIAAMGPEVNTWAAQANTLAGQVNALAADAETSATAAESAADAVLSQGTTADAWDDGAYSQYEVAIGSDGRAYRATVAISSGSGIDPVSDLTGTWVALNPDPGLIAAMILGGGIYPGWDFQVQDPAGNYPPTDDLEPDAWVWSRGVERYRALLTWGTTGGEEGSIIEAECEYSTDSGSNYDPVATNSVLTITYSTNGAVIAGAWSAAS